MLPIIQPFSLEFTPCTVVVHPTAMLLPIQPSTLIFILVLVHHLAFISSLIFQPFPIIDSTICKLKNSFTLFFVPYPFTNVFISIFEVISTSTMLIAIKPITLEFFLIGITVDSETLLVIFLPLSIIDSSTFEHIDSPTLFFPIQEFALIFFTIGVEVHAISREAIIFPATHVHIPTRESVDTPSRPCILVLSDVFPTIRVRHLLELLSQIPLWAEELCQIVFLKPHSCRRARDAWWLRV